MSSVHCCPACLRESKFVVSVAWLLLPVFLLLHYCNVTVAVGCCCFAWLVSVTRKVRDYDYQNSNYITVTYTSNSIVAVLLERAVYMLPLAAFLISDKNICPQISDQSIKKWVKF